MAFSLEEKIKHFAISSRLGIIVLQCVANALIPDHNAGVFQKPLVGNASRFDAFVDFTLGGLTRWDGQYFLHVAQYGYTYENTLAFFPLFPLLIRQLSYLLLFFTNELSARLFPQLENIMSLHSALIIVSVLLNNFLFVQTALVLYRLTCQVLKSEKLAFLSAILFCVNPASIFFSAVYSESLYCFLTFYGLLRLEMKNSVVTYLAIGLTGAVRSNGLINLGFIAYKYLKIRITTKMSFLFNFIFISGAFLSVFPFVFYQLYCYVKFCSGKSVHIPDFLYQHGVSNDFVFPGNFTAWCTQPFPMAYTYVQKRYWNVDFLSYYELKQLPNFLLALPVIHIVLWGCYEFAKRYKLLLLYLGFYDDDPGTDLHVFAFPYVLHGFALTVFAILMIHIQVTTRLLCSSSPLPYWFSARIFSHSMKDPVQTDVFRKLRRQKKSLEYYREPDESNKSRPPKATAKRERGEAEDLARWRRRKKMLTLRNALNSQKALKPKKDIEV
ncbi:hypothetical protein RUM44_006079 [Polyplax serrata]|uniref:GPI mannosyltransferase 2 n=1 Tax=Polyplax serrata TaxID=468196 RepID=A0ABR1AYX6_POLSC